LAERTGGHSEEKMMLLTGPKKNSATPTGGEPLPDGSVLELLRAPSELEEAKLLRWNGKASELAAQIEYGGCWFVPPPLEPSVKKASRLPTQIAPEETTCQLFTATESLLTSCLGQPESYTTMLRSPIFASGLFGSFPTSPLIWILASEGSPKFAALGLLGALCRHAPWAIGTLQLRRMWRLWRFFE
jgi:hypothetical protein